MLCEALPPSLLQALEIKMFSRQVQRLVNKTLFPAVLGFFAPLLCMSFVWRWYHAISLWENFLHPYAWTKSSCCYFNTVLLAKPLQNFSLSLQANVILFIYLTRGFSSSGRQDKSLLFCVVATLEPVIPSLNHITKLAQRRRENVMQAFGWESWDGDKAFPGSLMALFLFKGKKYAFISLEGQVVKYRG